MSLEMANETNLCAEASRAVRTRNGGGSGWCGKAFSKFSAQLSCCIFSGFTDFQSTFDNFMPLVAVLCQIFLAIRGYTERFMQTFSVSLKPLSCLLGSTCPKAVCHWAVSSGGSDLSCRQYDRPNKAMIASSRCRYWEEKPKLKPVSGMCFWHVMPQVVLKWFSLLICHWKVIHISQP